MSDKILDDIEVVDIRIVTSPPPSGEGYAEIQSTNIPDIVDPYTEFTIEYTVINTGESDTLWGHIINTNTGVEIPNTFWSQTFDKNETKTIQTQFSGGIGNTLYGKIEVGHMED